MKVFGLEGKKILYQLDVFRDAMSKVPTSVSVVSSYSFDSQAPIVAATISSLVSISVNPGGEEVLFALKNESFLGSHLLRSSLCSISVLNDEQHEIAHHFGSSNSTRQSPEDLGEKYWNRSRSFPYIDDAFVVFSCEVLEVIKRTHSTIYFARVFQFLTDDKKKPLVYFDRKFHVIHQASK